MKKTNLIFAFSLVAGIALVSCSKAEPTNNPSGNQKQPMTLRSTLATIKAEPTNNPAVNPTANTNSSAEVAVINTTEGTMVVAFWPDVAPNTVANFK